MCASDLACSPSGSEAVTREHCFPDRDNLFADENAEQPDERHQRRRRRANIEKAVDDADQNTGTKPI